MKIRSNLTREQVPALRQRMPIKNSVVSHHVRTIGGSQREITNKLKEWLQKDNTFYLGFGGIGDFLLVLASFYDDRQAAPIFFANGHSIPIIQKFLKLFNLNGLINLNIMGTKFAPDLYNLIVGHSNFRMSAHLADNMDYGDWINEHKYINRIRTKTNWRNFGETSGFTIIAPSGSHRDFNRQRFLTNTEYNYLFSRYANPIGIGSESDHKNYGGNWVTSEYISIDGHKKSHHLVDLLKIINGAREVVSVDTWVKTYSLLVDVPTTVIKTRWSGNFKEYGEDVTDWIFLNPKIWPKLKSICV